MAMPPPAPPVRGEITAQHTQEISAMLGRYNKRRRSSIASSSVMSEATVDGGSLEAQHRVFHKFFSFLRSAPRKLSEEVMRSRKEGSIDLARLEDLAGKYEKDAKMAAEIGHSLLTKLEEVSNQLVLSETLSTQRKMQVSAQKDDAEAAKARYADLARMVQSHRSGDLATQVATLQDSLDRVKKERDEALAETGVMQEQLYRLSTEHESKRRSLEEQLAALREQLQEAVAANQRANQDELEETRSIASAYSSSSSSVLDDEHATPGGSKVIGRPVTPRSGLLAPLRTATPLQKTILSNNTNNSNNNNNNNNNNNSNNNGSSTPNITMDKENAGVNKDGSGGPVSAKTPKWALVSQLKSRSTTSNTTSPARDPRVHRAVMLSEDDLISQITALRDRLSEADVRTLNARLTREQRERDAAAQHGDEDGAEEGELFRNGRVNGYTHTSNSNSSTSSHKVRRAVESARLLGNLIHDANASLQGILMDLAKNRKEALGPERHSLFAHVYNLMEELVNNKMALNSYGEALSRQTVQKLQSFEQSYARIPLNTRG